MSPPKLCTAAVNYCALLGLLSQFFLSLNLSHRSALCVDISLSLCHRCIIKKYFILCCHACNWVPRAISAPPTVPRPIHGRLLTKTELLSWAFKRDGRLFKEDV